MKDLIPVKTAFELSLSSSQRFARWIFGAAVGYVCTQAAERTFDDALKWYRRRKG
jgi:hypothetical protein